MPCAPLVLSCLLFAPAPAAQGPAARPNILWISSEDNGPDLGCYGCPDADTPNLDALATRGTLYTHCWSNAPVCAAARTTIITGMYPPALGAEHHRSRVRLPAGVELFPVLLRRAGYYCTNNAKTDYNLEGLGKVWDASSGQAHWRNRRPGQPFFAVFNLAITHESRIRARPHRPVHDPAKITVPPYHPDTPEVRRDWAQYHDKMTEMDTRAGALLRELDQAGLSEHTIVFYWGDHGAGLPGHKRNPKNRGQHVPLIVAVPERHRAHAGTGEPGARSDRLVSFVDLAPTVLSLAGVEPPAFQHGRAFLGPRRSQPTGFLHGFRGRMDERPDLVRTVCDGRYVYTRNYLPWLPLGKHVAYMFQTPTTTVWYDRFVQGRLSPQQRAFWEPRAPEELYDLQEDPHETRNLADSAEHAPVLERLRAEHRRHVLALGDLGFVPEGDLHLRTGDRPPAGLLRGEEPAIDLARLFEVAWRASLPDQDHVPFLTEAVDDPDPAVRTWALRGLAHRGHEVFAAARDRFATALEDSSPDVRVVAAEALVRHGDSTAHRALDTLAACAVVEDHGLFTAIASWNALDSLGEAAAPLRGRLPPLPLAGKRISRPFANYLPNLRAEVERNLGGK